MSKLFERLLEVRGIGEDFLHPKYENLSDPYLLPDMEKAVTRLEQAAEKGEKVIIYGDYDVDGVTASTVMSEILKMIGVKEVEVMLPNRFRDGYGMNERVVERAKECGAKLVITVDCGTNNREIIEKLNEAGVEVVVTDHHELSGELPEAVAVVNPKVANLEDESSDVGVRRKKGLRNLCGAGVAFMIARALVKRGKIPDGQEKWLLDLVTIGTICDSMKMRGDNRIICYYGMIVLSKTRRQGLIELMKVAGVKKLDTEAIGFQIGPRLNAAGRVKSAEVALNLLMTKDKVEAVSLAMELDKLNKERKRQQEDATKEIAERGDFDNERVIVVQGKWNEGVLGIIAGRLTERYRKPSIVLTEVEKGLKGSGRSFGDFNLAEALRECQNLLVSGGGHAEACGLMVKNGELEGFRRKINDYYDSLGLKNQGRFLEVKEDLRVGDIRNLSLELVEEISQLEPYGEGNEEPVFKLSETTILDVKPMGENKAHLGIVARGQKGSIIRLVAFYARPEWFQIEAGREADIWVRIFANEWNGTSNIEGRILRVEKRNDI